VGEIYDQRLSDPDGATSIYERVLEADPEHTRALAALARLYESAGDWDRCAEVLRKAAAAGRGGPDEAEVHFRLARLHETHLDDATGALVELQRAVALFPGHVEANEALVEQARSHGDHDELLAALLRQEMYLEEAKAKVAKLLQIAELQAGPLSDHAGAVSSLERARDLDPGDVSVLLKLSDAYVNAGQQQAAIPVIEALIEAESKGGKRKSKQAAVYHHQLAKAYLSAGDQARALDNLEEAYRLDVSNVEVLISLGRLSYEQEQWDKALKLFRALLLQRFDASAGVSKADVYWYVGDIQLRQGDARKAKAMFQRGLDEDRNHEGCKEGLTRV
jgi:tetratricopeptide (TPR) repeat protein